MAIDEKILRYFELTEMHAQLKQVLDHWVATAGREFPDKFEDMKRKLAEGDLIGSMFPIYAEHFSEEEVDALIAFYGSPVGRKVTATHQQMSARKNAVIQKFILGVMGL